MSEDKPLANRQQVDQFLQQVAQTPAPQQRGRLVFALDATASRQQTWDQACQLQGDMFFKTRGIGNLNIQIAFYRGYDEFRVAPWHSSPDKLLKAMQTVSCLGGKTQIRKVLQHAIDEHQRQPIQALVFVGDSVEEPVDLLAQFAGKLGIMAVPVFIFQEGSDATARFAFSQIAKLSGGAHCQFDGQSATHLGELLNAVAVYATGGYKALTSAQASPQVLKQLTQQLRK